VAGRRLALKEAFRPSLDRLRITWDAAERARIAAVLRDLMAGPLPGVEDHQTVLYPAGVAWVRQVPGRRLWILYRFDDDVVSAIALVDRRPVHVGD